ncbi:MAG: discoidin domain-containing protein [Bacteroidaceae bacterium]|nr:discoidin domain-containing protein [Bacteroidaceae bacterium]
MGNRYLILLTLLFPLATMFRSGGLYAQTEEEYDAAMAAITDGATYYIATDVDGLRCYLTADGFLAYDKLDAGMFIFKKTSGGEFKTYGWYLDGGTGNYFSNPAASNSIADKKINTHSISGCRTTWEAQVFFLNENGKFAVRATNAASTTSTSGWNWVGQSFWAINEGPTVGYSFDVNYIWELELPSDQSQIWTVLNSIVVDYEEQVYDDEDGYSMNIGTGFGQRADAETWLKFWNLLQEVYQTAQKLVEEDYDMDKDPDAPTLEWANQARVDADSMYQKILDSERPYMIPQDGYYRIISRLRYSNPDVESGYVDKALAASISSEHANKGVYATIKRDRADFLWKLTQHGDSVEIQNAGMETYISFSSPSQNRVIMTTNVDDASHMVLDYAGYDIVETDEDAFEKDIFYIRLASKPRGGSNYFHQLEHNSKTDVATASGNSGTDSGKEMELSFWAATFNKEVDRGTSEWYLEYVPDEEAKEIIEAFAYIRDRDILIEKNNALRAEVAEALTVAKDVIRTELITSASQMTSPFSYNELTGKTDGGNLSDGVLIDGDKSTYWHSDYSGAAPEGTHYIQLSGMQDMVGDCELYLCQRAATNDHPKEFIVVGSNDPEAADEDWAEIAVIEIPNVLSGEENTVPFVIETPYEYVRLLCTQQAPSTRNFFHAAELQILTVRPNPNSQFVALGEIATNLENIYNENCAVDDDDITVVMYEALLAAYQRFLNGLVDPTELREAMAKYANATRVVVEGTNPGQWSSTDIATAYDNLYAEVVAYNKAGKYTVEKNHKYAVMLATMQKSLMEQANGVKKDTWYRIMFPTEEMYDRYGFDKSPADKTSLREDQATMWGTFVTVAKEVSEEVPNPTEEDPDATTNVSHLEAFEKADVRETNRMFFMAEDEITDKDVSLFRFIECPVKNPDYSGVFTEAKGDMVTAVDLSTTYTRGEALITDASQFSSNNDIDYDGQRLSSGCLIDGNASTYWHTDYRQQVLEIPYLQVALNEPVSGFIQVDITRRNAANGHVVRMYIQGSTDAENWKNVGYLETPFGSVTETVTSQPVDLDGTYNYLRFILTQRYGTDGGGNMEFDPFAEITGASDWNKKWTYFHMAEFQIYPITFNQELSPTAKTMQQAYTTANKVVLKDVTAEDFATVKKAYKDYQTEYNTSVGKAVLPNGVDGPAPSYALQNKATGLFIKAKDGSTNDVNLKLIPTFFSYTALGYERSLLGGVNINGNSCNNLHAGESNRRFCTWSSSEAYSNSGLVIREEGPVEPAEFSFYKDIQTGEIYNFCSTVSITNKGEGEAYAGIGKYTDEDGATFLALKKIETIEAGAPAFYIFGDTTQYDAEAEPEAVLFTMSAEPDFKLVGDTINGFIACLVNHPIGVNDIFFDENYATSLGKTGMNLVAPAVLVVQELCPDVDPNAEYDFSICLSGADVVDNVKDVATVVKQISQPGDVYSVDGKLLKTGATLNSLKSLGKGMYILNGIKVMVK